MGAENTGTAPLLTGSVIDVSRPMRGEAIYSKPGDTAPFLDFRYMKILPYRNVTL